MSLKTLPKNHQFNPLIARNQLVRDQSRPARPAPSVPVLVADGNGRLLCVKQTAYTPVNNPADSHNDWRFTSNYQSLNPEEIVQANRTVRDPLKPNYSVPQPDLAFNINTLRHNEESKQQLSKNTNNNNTNKSAAIIDPISLNELPLSEWPTINSDYGSHSNLKDIKARLSTTVNNRDVWGSYEYTSKRVGLGGALNMNNLASSIESHWQTTNRSSYKPPTVLLAEHGQSATECKSKIAELETRLGTNAGSIGFGPTHPTYRTYLNKELNQDFTAE